MVETKDNGVGVERSSENESYQLIGEGDSLCAIGWEKGEASPPWSIAVLVEEIQGLIRGSTCLSPSITFLRSANEEADSLASLGVTRLHVLFISFFFFFEWHFLCLTFAPTFILAVDVG